MATKWVVVYRRLGCKRLPKVGFPDDVRPGDILTFFRQGYRNRRVASIHPGYIIIEPLIANEKPFKVPHGDFDKAVREVQVDAPADPPAPPPKPKKKPPAKKKKPPPKAKEPDPPKPKKPKKRYRKKPPIDFLDFLDDRYREDD